MNAAKSNKQASTLLALCVTALLAVPGVAAHEHPESECPESDLTKSQGTTTQDISVFPPIVFFSLHVEGTEDSGATIALSASCILDWLDEVING